MKNLGIDSDMVRIFSQQIREADEADRILRLPIDTRYYRPIQDPVTGALYFMYGVHPYGGSNPYGGI